MGQTAARTVNLVHLVHGDRGADLYRTSNQSLTKRNLRPEFYRLIQVQGSRLIKYRVYRTGQAAIEGRCPMLEPNGSLGRSWPACSQCEVADHLLPVYICRITTIANVSSSLLYSGESLASQDWRHRRPVNALQIYMLLLL